MNELVKRGEIKAPIVIGRDHLDTGSVASPNRETEGMLDGSDAIADWALLNALINTAAGASWVSISEVSNAQRSEEQTAELQSRLDLVCRLPLGKKQANSGHRTPVVQDTA